MCCISVYLRIFTSIPCNLPWHAIIRHGLRVYVCRVCDALAVLDAVVAGGGVAGLDAAHDVAEAHGREVVAQYGVVAWW